MWAAQAVIWASVPPVSSAKVQTMSLIPAPRKSR